MALNANPYFETNVTTAWGTNGAATTTQNLTTSAQGVACMQIDSTAVASSGVFSDNPTARPGEQQIVSVYAKGNVGGENVDFSLEFHNAGGGVISLITNTLTLTTTFTRYEIIGVCPALTASVVTTNYNKNGVAGAAQRWFVDIYEIDVVQPRTPDRFTPIPFT